MDHSALASSLPDISWTMGNTRTWSQTLFWPWLAAIYEQRVARICRDCRVNEEWVSESPSMAATTGGASKVVDNLERRSHLFIKRCKEEWLELHIVGMFLSGTIAMILTNKSMRANIIARTAALLSLEFAIASAVYAAVYVWRIVPAMKNFPHILRHTARHPNEYTHVWAVFALPTTYLACSVLLLAITFLVVVWTSDAGLPQHISAPLWSHLLLIIGIAYPLCRSFQVWETFHDLCEPIKALDNDKV